MRRLIPFLLLFLSGVLPAAESPRLALLIVVDQMTPGTLSALLENPGLKKALSGSVIFDNVRHDHVPTETAPGHATIITGQPPSRHGIISNEIFDRSTRKTTPAVEDPERGTGPFRLRSRTLGEALKARHPRARVVSVSFKDRSAIFLGGQNPDAAVWYNHDAQRFVTSSYYGAAPDWVAPANDHLKGIVGTARSPFSPADLRASPLADRALVFLSTQAIAGWNLGADDDCDLLMVSLSATDYIGHRWGPDSPQMRAQTKVLAGLLRDLLSAAKEASGGRLVVAMTSDHGVQSVPESPQGRALNAQRVTTRDFVRNLESSLQALHPAKGKRWIAGVELPDVYLNRALATERRLSWTSFLRDAARALSSAPHVAAVYIPGQPAQDDYGRVFERSRYPALSGDLQIRTGENVLVTRWPTGTSHGSPYDHDAVVPAVFVGTGGKPGTVSRRVSVESIAPTLAAALGIPFTTAAAPVLSEALSRP